MIWTPNVVVAAVVERDGRFLVVEEEAEGRLVINQPAGHLDRGESLVDAVRRETLEETAWTLQPASVIGVYLYTPPDTDRAYLRICFAGEVTTHDPSRPLDREIVRTLWLTRTELGERSAQLRSPLVLASIDDYLAGQSHPLSLLHWLPLPRAGS